MHKTFTDQLGRAIDVRWPPERIVSLVPSQTELLHYLGLEKEVVGITKFCIHPQHWYSTKTRVGGTKNTHFDAIKQLNPDVIIANKEENDMAQIMELSKHFPLWVSDIKTLEHAQHMISSLGQLTNKLALAEQLVSDIKLKFELAPISVNNRVAYLIWNNPMMTVNHDTFIHDMLLRCGWINVFAEVTDSRYPQISEELLIAANPEVLLLSSEPFPFAAKHIKHFTKILPHTKVMMVDGEMFSWYGSRLLQAPAYFKQLLQEMNN
jgi:ABC-type Fe3+-hydroxamate transport system substrate-binding protein